jgi:hypothetical protein
MNTLTRELVNKELKDIPDILLLDLYEYIKYLKFKKRGLTDKIETTYASEVALSKDWNRPEEEEAWKDL